MAGVRPLSRTLRFLRRHLPPLNFITVHYAYFIVVCLVSAVIFWGSSTPPRSVSFTNSLFFTVSAMTLAGLNTINLSKLNTFQQIILFVLILLGSSIFVSAFVVGLREKAFEKKFAVVTEEREANRRGRARQRVRDWAETTLGRRSRETSRNEGSMPRVLVRDADSPGEINEKAGGTAPTGEDERSVGERDLTPPARRGGPEMNGISSETGARLDIGSPLSPIRSHITFSEETRFRTSHPTQHIRPRSSSRSLFNMQGVGARRGSSLNSTGPDLQSLPSFQRTNTQKSQGDISRYFASAAGWISRNSQFHGLTREERDLLGGCEYRAVHFLSYLVPLYFVLWQLLGCLGCGAWVAYNNPEAARINALNPWWVGAFNAVSAFNNSGMSLLDANMVAFQRSYYLLLTLGLLILAGNTCYPIFLRLIIWCLYKIVSWKAEGQSEDNVWTERTRTLKFLLDHPRRCYTHLFPAQHTWWLALSVFTLNAVDWAAFEILNIGNSELDAQVPIRYRIIDGLFQAFAVRSGGFYVVQIPSLRISLLVLYVLMMYVSVFPVVITMRNSNVYEERSLGIFAEDEIDDAETPSSSTNPTDKPTRRSLPFLRHARTIGNHFVGGAPSGLGRESNSHFVRHQLRAQLSHDAWWIALALFLIMICEAHEYHENPVVFSVFNFIFEIVSAYGCVGISVGVPNHDYSFCGAWSTLSKLILCAVMLRGRHRGLPVAIDKAVLLPSELEGIAEEEDGRIRLERAGTMSREREHV